MPAAPEDHYLPARRLRRLERMAARAKLKMMRETERTGAEDVRDSLATLRKGLDATGTRGKGEDAQEDMPDYRERRQAATELARHHREMLKLAQPDKGGVTVNNDNRRQVAVAIPEEFLNDPAKRAAILALTEQELNGSA